MESKFLKDFKNSIKEELNDPKESKHRRSKTKDPNLKISLRGRSLRRQSDSKNGVKTNLLIYEHQQPKETSRFGTTTPVKVIENDSNQKYKESSRNSSISRIDHTHNNQPYLEGHNIGYEMISDRVQNHEGTLSLSHANQQHENNYYIEDSSRRGNFGYQDVKYRRGTRKRIKHYESVENNDYGSSVYDTASRNSKGSYRFEYLMNKAFTPIVPTNHYLNDVSKISWNRQGLLDNISYSDITESVLMGRNSTLMQNNHTDKIIRNKKVLTLSNKGMSLRSKQSFKSPQPPKRPEINVVYHKSLSKDRSELSAVQNESRFPPIGFGKTDGTMDSKNENYINMSRNKSLSNKSQSNRRIKSKSNDTKSNKSIKDYKSVHPLESNIIQNPAINFPNTDKHQLIKYTPVQQMQETPRLPGQFSFRNNMNMNSNGNGNGKSNIEHPKEIELDKSEVSSLNDSGSNLKGFLNSQIKYNQNIVSKNK